MNKEEKLQYELLQQVIDPITSNRMILKELLQKYEIISLIVIWEPILQVNKRSGNHEIIEKDIKWIISFSEFQYKIDKSVFEWLKNNNTHVLIRSRNGHSSNSNTKE